ncbi:helix-turn-helix transcriptional regulator [Caulobacter sp. SSI4214]|uniref:helix-turn-helix domain-containing protein n=1 Tax=Caulobacter sp. SSI4214 TaxID=2575739 RepID=UPI0014398A21|nr:helix-turn-helix transcriptional regulator [Caulobacter sp. SSI4214]
MYIILAVAGGWFAYAQVRYLAAQRAYDRLLAHSVVEVEQARKSDEEAASKRIEGSDAQTKAPVEPVAAKRPLSRREFKPQFEHEEDEGEQGWTSWVPYGGNPTGSGGGRTFGEQLGQGQDVVLTFGGPAVASVEGLSRLSTREMECLRLVDRHMSSKEIARELGLSKHTVDWHLDKARRRLGAVDRYEAARRVFDSGLGHASAQEPSADTGWGVNRVGPPISHAQAAFVQAERPGDARDPLHSQHGDGRDVHFEALFGSNKLGLGFRLAFIAAVMVLTAFAMGVLLAGVHVLSSVLPKHG